MSQVFAIVAPQGSQPWGAMKRLYELGGQVDIWRADADVLKTHPQILGLTAEEYMTVLTQSPHWIIAVMEDEAAESGEGMTYIGNVAARGGSVDFKGKEGGYRFAQDIHKSMVARNLDKVTVYPKQLVTNEKGYWWLECSTISEEVKVHTNEEVEMSPEQIVQHLKGGDLKTITGNAQLAAVSAALVLKDLSILALKGGKKVHDVGKPMVKAGLRGGGKGLGAFAQFLQKLGQ